MASDLRTRLLLGAGALQALALVACATAYDRVEIAGVLVRIDDAVPPPGEVLQPMTIPSSAGAHTRGTSAVAVDERAALRDLGSPLPAAPPPRPDPAAELLAALDATAVALRHATATATAEGVPLPPEAVRELEPLCARLGALAAAAMPPAPAAGGDPWDGAARLRERRAALARGEPSARPQPPPLLVYDAARPWASEASAAAQPSPSPSPPPPPPPPTPLHPGATP